MSLTLQKAIIHGFVSIPLENKDLNTCILTGLYHQHHGFNTDEDYITKNYPAQKSSGVLGTGTLEVFNIAGYVRQSYYSILDPTEVWVRAGILEYNFWTPWINVNCPAIGSFDIQFPEDDGTFDEEKTPAYKYGGYWALRFNTDSAFFRTEGARAAAGRVNGVQGDAIRNITGSITSIPYQVTGVGAGAIVTNAGSVRTTTDSLNDNRSSGFSFDASRVVPTAAENRVKNYLIRVWEREV